MYAEYNIYMCIYIYIHHIYIYVLYTNIYICICMNHIASTSWGTPKSFETVRLRQAGPGYATLARDGPKESMGSVGHPDGCSFGAVGGGCLGWFFLINGV